ncbi:MAG: hypothetical protein IT247_01045 [Bacteroidia bacterium]|nr:hypothetical protein [Bacteroidia bacterium]
MASNFSVYHSVKFASIIISFMLLGACTKNESTPGIYTKYTIQLEAKTNLHNVNFVFTDRFKEIVAADLDSPGIVYVYDEMKKGDIIYVSSFSPDSGYIDCSIKNKESLIFHSSSTYDTINKLTQNNFAFPLP